MKITAYSTYNLHQLRYNPLQPLQPITAGNTSVGLCDTLGVLNCDGDE